MLSKVVEGFPAKLSSLGGQEVLLQGRMGEEKIDSFLDGGTGRMETGT